MKVQFFKDFSRLSETSDLFIVETDQFGLIDGNGNSYDLDSRENFLKEKYKGLFALHTHGSGLYFEHLNVPQEAVVKTVSRDDSSFVELKNLKEALIRAQNDVNMYKSNSYAFEEDLVRIDRKYHFYKTSFIFAVLVIILLTVFACCKITGIMALMS